MLWESGEMPLEGAESRAFSAPIGSANRTSHKRWVICSLLFLATVIAYVDRGVIAYLEKFLEGVIPGLNSVKYGLIVGAFTAAYAIGMVVAGAVTDKLGTRKAFAIAIGLWSLAAMLPGAAFSVITLGVAMFLIGLGEAANFPACNKTVAEWFPRRERALATGIFNSGANVGNMIVPLVVPFLVVVFSWRGAFVAIGASGLVWLIFWLTCYRRPEQDPSVSQAELALILSDPAEEVERFPWSRVLPCKETWAFGIAKLLTDPIWWFYLYWLPGYFSDKFHLSLAGLGLPILIVYNASAIGSIYGGYLPASFIRMGLSAERARLAAMFLCACLIVPIFLINYLHADDFSKWAAIGLLSLAAAAHQGWSANLFTTASDMFPRTAVGSVTGIGTMAGALGGFLFAKLAGHVLQISNSYSILFIIAASVYLISLLINVLLAPGLKKVEFAA